jgi:hypothetical protein
MNIPITSQHLDSAWNRYLEADERRFAAFTQILDELIALYPEAAVLVEPARQAHALSVLAMREAASGIRRAQADLFTVLSLRTSELRDMQVGMQVEAGLMGRVAELETRLARLELADEQSRTP